RVVARRVEEVADDMKSADVPSFGLHAAVGAVHPRRRREHCGLVRRRLKEQAAHGRGPEHLEHPAARRGSLGIRDRTFDGDADQRERQRQDRNEEPVHRHVVAADAFCLIPLTRYVDGTLAVARAARRGALVLAFVLVSAPVVLALPERPWFHMLVARVLISHYAAGAFVLLGMLCVTLHSREASRPLRDEPRHVAMGDRSRGRTSAA